MKRDRTESPLAIFGFAPSVPKFGFDGATDGSLMLSSRRGGGRRSGPDQPDELYDDPAFDDYDSFDEYDDGLTDSTEPQTRPVSRRAMRTQGGPGGGGQPDARFWTDYLRIALPILGLLLMLGLLWFWATQLIGTNEDVTTPEPTDVAAVNTEVAPTRPATEDGPAANGGTTPAANDADTIGVNSTTTNPPAPTQPPAPTAAPTQAAEPTATTAASTALETGSVAVITEDGVNVRPDSNTTQDPVGQLNTGDKVNIVSGPIEGENYTWYEITSEDGTLNGFVVEDFLDPAP